MGRIARAGSGALAGAALALSGAAVSHAQQAQPTSAAAQQGPSSGPPPGEAVRVQVDELTETWNGRVAAGPVATTP